MSFIQTILSLSTNNPLNLSEIKNLSPSYLEEKRLSMDQSEYLKYLKRLSGVMEAHIISQAEKGGKRNEELENKLRLLDNEIKKYS